MPLIPTEDSYQNEVKKKVKYFIGYESEKGGMKEFLTTEQYKTLTNILRSLKKNTNTNKHNFYRPIQQPITEDKIKVTASGEVWLFSGCDGEEAFPICLLPK